MRATRAMESDTERGVGSFGNDGEELSPMMTITSLNRGMDSIVAKAGTLSTLENIKGITSFERKFKRAIDTTPFGCYPSMLLDVYEGTVGWSETDMRFVEKGWRRVQEQMASTRTSSSVLLALSGNPNELYESKNPADLLTKAVASKVKFDKFSKWIMGYVDESVLAFMLALSTCTHAVLTCWLLTSAATARARACACGHKQREPH